MTRPTIPDAAVKAFMLAWFPADQAGASDADCVRAGLAAAWPMLLAAEGVVDHWAVRIEGRGSADGTHDYRVREQAARRNAEDSGGVLVRRWVGEWRPAS